MRVVFTTAARADLAEIGDHIARDNGPRAGTFVQELVSVCEDLAEMPTLWPIVPRYGQWGYRRRVYGQYLIFYRALQDRIDIVRVVHGSRDFVRHLTPHRTS